MARLNWDKATAQERVRTNGSDPSWFGLPQPASLNRPAKLTKGARRNSAKARSRARTRKLTARNPAGAAERLCMRVSTVVAEFIALPAWEQAASLNACQGRIRRICSDERRELQDSPQGRHVLLEALREMDSQRMRVAELLIDE